MDQRKTDHIMLAASSAPAMADGDPRFYYEPLIAAHPGEVGPLYFLGKKMLHPLWISSMTGGSEQAQVINPMLAEACAEFGLGMGLGSCRALLKSNEHFGDFNLRPVLGNSVPFFANIGIAQVEELSEKGEFGRIDELMGRLSTDGIFVHLNPTQEWLQPEGDRQKFPADETIARFVEFVNHRYAVFVKEVGQGMGPESLSRLLTMDIDGVELGAFGGTNFAAIELMRNRGGKYNYMYPLATVGHNATEMINWVNEWSDNNPGTTKQVIVSGGVRNFLDGYFYIKKLKQPAVYGMANALLQQALSSKNDLFDFIRAEIDGFRFASKFLKVR